MSQECTHDCSTCSANCGERKQPSLEDFRVNLNAFSNVKKVIAIMSGKGGVGKSAVTSMLAVLLNRMGYKTAVLDADITGPSIPKMFGVTERPDADNKGILAPESKLGTKIMSVNLILDNETSPVVWRGPVIAGVVQQFWTDVCWDDVDFMFVDMPPGTGDVPLTVFQSLPVDGAVVVTTPQKLVSMIVEKAVNMAGMMNIPVIGLVENMSYFKCPDCGGEYDIFGKSSVKETAEKFGIEKYARVPMDPNLAKICDNGAIELLEGEFLDELAKSIADMLK